MEYITRPDKDDAATSCVFCDLIGDEATPERDRLILHQQDHAVVLMNKFPYNNGHLLVMPRQHRGRLDELDDATFSDIHQLVSETVNVLEKALSAEGVNVGLNLGRAAGAGIPGHLHYHLVPRWVGDNNFMPVIGETKIISQHILHSYDQIKPHFA